VFLFKVAVSAEIHPCCPMFLSQINWVELIVPYWVYKHCAIELAFVLTHIINTVVDNATPPSMWLKPLVTPVP